MHKIELCDKNLCTGCLACYNACTRDAIQIKTDDEGFYYPFIERTKCVECGRCVSSCPVLKNLPSPNAQKAYKGWACDEEILRHSSSGGLFSVLSNDVLKYDNKGAVYGAAFEKDFTLRHRRVDKIEDLKQLRGSKYVQSYTGRIYNDVKKDLHEGKKVLFCGTPCQIAGLNEYLGRKHYSNLLTVDLVCHGVPSPRVFRSYVNYLEQTNKSSLVSFNNKKKKWCWTRYNSIATFNNGTTYTGKWEEDPYTRGFLRDLFLRPSCHHCKFANMNRQSDITLADYWSYYPKKREKKNRERGVSLILVNSKKGAIAFEAIKKYLVWYPISIEEAMNCNLALSRCFPASPKRDFFWRSYNNAGFQGVIEDFLFKEITLPHYQMIYKYGKDSFMFKLYRLKSYVLNKIIRILSRCLYQ